MQSAIRRSSRMAWAMAFVSMWLMASRMASDTSRSSGALARRLAMVFLKSGMSE